MKIKIMLKDPDGVYEALQEAAEESLGDAAIGLSARTIEQLVEKRQEELDTACEKWIEYSEYVQIEIDTDAGTAIVLPA